MRLRQTPILLIIMAVLVTGAAAQGTAAQSQPQSGAVQSANKGQVQARTQEEYDAYQAIKNRAQSPEEFQKSVDDFAAKFPDSNLRIVLYRGVMKSFQQADDPDKMMAAGLKVLAMSLVSAGLLVGVVLPVLFVMFDIEVLMLSSGFDAIWLVFLAMMIVDFVMAWRFWRREAALERAAQGLPPRE